jgi:hypothetical protein
MKEEELCGFSSLLLFTKGNLSNELEISIIFSVFHYPY